MIKTELQKQINNEKPESNEQIGKFENSWERRMNTVHQTILIPYAKLYSKNKHDFVQGNQGETPSSESTN